VRMDEQHIADRNGVERHVEELRALLSVAD